MRKTVKKITAILVLLMAAALLLSCSDADDKAPVTEPQQTTAAAEESENTAEPEETEPQLVVPEYNFNGGEISVLVLESEGWVTSRDFEYFDESAGEPVNDAVKDRVIKVEEQFNCVLHPIHSKDLVTAAKSEIMAGGTAYDFIMPKLAEVKTVASEGLLHDLNKIDTLKLDQPWWNQNAVESLSIAHKLFFGFGDISLIDNDGIATMGFSKKLVADNDLTSPYEFVYNDTWTIDAMQELCKGMNRDLDGDGKMGKNDQYGFVNGYQNIVMFVYGAGEKLISKDKDDIPYSTMVTDRKMDVIDRYIEFMKDDTAYGDLGIFGDHAAATPYFNNDQMLFRMSTMFRFTLTREMDSDFGFIPIPKFDEQQDSYHHAFSTASPAVSIPITIVNANEIGAVIEALSYYGRYILLPAYYEINLQTKIVRDEESAGMLDIIYDTSSFDLGFVYDFSSICSIFDSCVSKGENTLASAYAAKEEAVNRQIDELIETYKALG